MRVAMVSRCSEHGQRGSAELLLTPVPGEYDGPYKPPRKRLSKWLIIGCPILLIIIIAAVVGGVVGSKKVHNSSSSSSSGGSNGTGTADSAHSSLLHEQGRFAISTDTYFLPVYPSTVSVSGIPRMRGVNVHRFRPTPSSLPLLHLWK
jgi:hypothetical protein